MGSECLKKNSQRVVLFSHICKVSWNYVIIISRYCHFHTRYNLRSRHILLRANFNLKIRHTEIPIALLRITGLVVYIFISKSLIIENV